MHQGVLWLIEGVAIYQIATQKGPIKSPSPGSQKSQNRTI